VLFQEVGSRTSRAALVLSSEVGVSHDARR
jgi:hypothetical protein